MCATTCEAVWLRRLLHDAGEEKKVATVIKCDNQISIKLANNPIFNKNTKNIDTQFHFVREKFSQRKSILNIVVHVTMLLIFSLSLSVESSLSCLGKC